MTFDSRPPVEHISKNEEATWGFTAVHQPRENVIGICWVVDHETGSGKLRTHAVYTGDFCKLPDRWLYNANYNCFDPVFVEKPETQPLPILTQQLINLGFEDEAEMQKLLFLRKCYKEGIYLS